MSSRPSSQVQGRMDQALQEPGFRPSDEELRNVYKPRLAYELEVLRKLSFSGDFLLVQDAVRLAKPSRILVGPGRGSVGGSVVAYLMGITVCDLIRFNLLFERFINPDRIDLADAQPRGPVLAIDNRARASRTGWRPVIPPPGRECLRLGTKHTSPGEITPVERQSRAKKGRRSFA